MKNGSSTKNADNVERFLRNLLRFIAYFLKSVITTVKGIELTVPERRKWKLQNAAELIGILQAISIVAKSLAIKLMQIEKEVQAYESGMAAAAGSRRKKGWK